MDAQVQAFKDAMAEKAAAKQTVMEALGRANRDNKPKDWDTVAEYGIHGVEGECMARAQKIADDYVKSHPEQVAYLLPYKDPAFQTTIIRDGLPATISGHEAVVNMVSLTRQSGLEEASLVITMFELASFERQQIGVAMQVKTRETSGSGA